MIHELVHETVNIKGWDIVAATDRDWETDENIAFNICKFL